MGTTKMALQLEVGESGNVNFTKERLAEKLKTWQVINQVSSSPLEFGIVSPQK